MSTYRKRPVEIEAWPVSELLYAMEHDWKALPAPIADAYEAAVIVAPTPDGFTVKTMEGDHFARFEDMLIRGVQGELYPCRPDIFAATYEPVR
jgi:hypothetical protein